MKKILGINLVAAALMSSVMLTQSAYANDVPSCYAMNQTDLKTPVADREIFVLIDQTTLLDDILRAQVMDNVGKFIKPGTTFTIATFSAFTQGHYMNIVKSGTLESDISAGDRDVVKVRILTSFDACMKKQWLFGMRMAADAITKSMSGASDTLAKSDVESSIKSFSDVVRASKVKDRVVLIVSDMLENSSISNFYASKNVRKIDPAKEMVAAKTNHAIGDFNGARVYVMGAGTVAETTTHAVYRDPKTMNALSQFWSEYFKESHANLVEFGEPALMSNIR